MPNINSKLRRENYKNSSGTLKRLNKIPLLKEPHYYVKPHELDGDAPKSFIKAYFYQKDNTIKKKNKKSWFSFIAKTAEKWYPHESVIEFMINRIGQELGLKMNEVKLVRINGQIRFLSKYFRNKDEILIHGAEICGQYLDDIKFAEQIANDKKTSRDLFTFEFIKESIQNVYPDNYKTIIADLIKLITFDALIGNNDRHFYNWGVIDYTKKNRKTPKFAPIYDSARGFLWNWDDEKIKKHLDLKNKGGKKIDRYIDESSPRISCDINKSVNHFELVKYLKNNPFYKEIINDLANATNEKKVLKLIQKEFFSYFIVERNEVIEYIIKKRFKIIREI